MVGSVKDLNHWNKSYSKVYFDKAVEKRSLVSILSKHKYPEDLNEVDFNNFVTINVLKNNCFTTVMCPQCHELKKITKPNGHLIWSISNFTRHYIKHSEEVENGHQSGSEEECDDDDHHRNKRCRTE